MKRPHRRTHFLIWVLLAPIIAVASVFGWMQRPGTPYSELPASIEEINDEEGAE
ncbi:MAG: hypothetical protein HKP25_05215 [Marinicaulis sp.]|nr:hypothetical protein [Marinicaulis sp.]NNL88450.1 hypothetical protein [Marinicaulis sp.]